MAAQNSKGYARVAIGSPTTGGMGLEVAVPRPRPSFVAVGYMVMLGDAVRGIFFPTLWPLVASYGGTRASQGLIVAAFSMGRMVISPYYGQYSTKHGHKGPLIFAHVLIIIGALLYSQVWSLYSLFAAQIVLGLGCGTLGVTRAYFAESVPREMRTVWLGRVTAMQYAGLTVTSFLGSAMSRAGGALQAKTQDDPAWAWLRISPLTFSAYAVLFGAIVALLILASPSFYDFVPAEKQPAPSEQGPNALARSRSDVRHVRVVTVGLLLNVVTKGIVGCYETLGVQYAMVNLDMTGEATGLVVAVCGVLGVAFLLSFKQLGRLFDDVELVLYGIAVMILSLVLMNRRWTKPLLDDDLDADSYAIWLTAMVAMYGVGYPVGHTAVIGWFSKAMKSRPQGFFLGIFGSAGSLARIVFPIASGFMAKYYNDDTVFTGLAAILTVTLVILVVFRQAFRDAIA
mmetsp:Transcript_8237/g.25767  ORF Transcript_8237/g.25767 Transcript_8237/m.25767 type:complete len:456 (+) Transcript_8237:843-2210(+)